MEPVPHWSWFSRSHADSGATAATNGCGHSQRTFYLFILNESTNNQTKIMNGERIDVACFSCYPNLESVTDTHWRQVPRRNTYLKVYSLADASHCWIHKLQGCQCILFLDLEIGQEIRERERGGGWHATKVRSQIRIGMLWFMVGAWTQGHHGATVVCFFWSKKIHFLTVATNHGCFSADCHAGLLHDHTQGLEALCSVTLRTDDSLSLLRFNLNVH